MGTHTAQGFYADRQTRPAQRERVVERAVFISYRGEDSQSYGALLYNELKGQFGEDHVFLDAESIPAGADFAKELLGRVRSARVVLVVIGPRWLTAADPATGRRRIDDPDDWIRRELVEAFAVGVRVIPVLTDHADLPREAHLPADIAALSRCQYRHLRRREPTADLARIVADLISLDSILATAADGTILGVPSAAESSTPIPATIDRIPVSEPSARVENNITAGIVVGDLIGVDASLRGVPSADIKSDMRIDKVEESGEVVGVRLRAETTNEHA
jgi:hypothetical protein